MNVFKGRFLEEYEKIKQERKKPSILVIGGTGTGKSTLVNLVFKREIAKTGAGRPVTKGIQLYENEYVDIYDCEGYATGEENQRCFNKLIEDFIAEKDEKNETAIHLIWYCVSAPSARFTDLDADLIKKMRGNNKPVAVVLTQIDRASEEQCRALKQVIFENGRLKDVYVFESTTDGNIETSKGLDYLHEWSLKHLDESRRLAFFSVSNRKLGEKQREGLSIVLQQVAAAGLIGGAPIPFADAPLLLAGQTAMIARLVSLWDMAQLQNLAAGGIMGKVLALLGKGLAGNLFKLFPGIGAIAGGLINAAIASALTFAVGQAVNITCHKIQADELNGKSVPIEDYLPFLQETIKICFERYNKDKKTRLQRLG